MIERSELVSEAVEELLAVYKEKLSAVAFPDVSLDILNDLIGTVEAVAERLDAAQKQVEEAQETLSAAQDELQQKCVKALAYAKIFAEGQEDLTGQLDTISFSRPAKSQKKAAPADKPKRESRSKKESAAEESGEEQVV